MEREADERVLQLYIMLRVTWMAEYGNFTIDKMHALVCSYSIIKEFMIIRGKLLEVTAQFQFDSVFHK